MSEFRRDRVSGRWVIIAPERAARPTDFPVERRYGVGGFCPFCEGHEDKTPPEVAALRSDPQQANRPGWRVRVVPNRFPALRPDAPLEVVGDAACRGMTGFGVHEVIIESPRHILSLNEMDDAGVADVLRIYQQRLMSMRQDSRFLYGMIFKNVGSAAGATVEHSHSQLIGMPVVPRTVRTEVRHARQFNDAAGACLFCHMIDQEIAKGERVVHVGRHCIAIAPYASRFPFETWILPTRHVPHFEDHPAETLGDIAAGAAHRAQPARPGPRDARLQLSHPHLAARGEVRRLLSLAHRDHPVHHEDRRVRVGDRMLHQPGASGERRGLPARGHQARPLGLRRQSLPPS